MGKYHDFDYGSKEVSRDVIDSGRIVSLNFELIEPGGEIWFRLDTSLAWLGQHSRKELGKKFLLDYNFLRDCMINKTPIVVYRVEFEDGRVVIDYGYLE